MLEGDLLGLNLGQPDVSNSGTSLPKAASNVDLLMGGFDSGLSAEAIKPSSTPNQPPSDIFDPFGIVILNFFIRFEIKKKKNFCRVEDPVTLICLEAGLVTNLPMETAWPEMERHRRWQQKAQTHLQILVNRAIISFSAFVENENYCRQFVRPSSR